MLKDLHWKYCIVIILIPSPVKSEAAFTHSIYFSLSLLKEIGLRREAQVRSSSSVGAPI